MIYLVVHLDKDGKPEGSPTSGADASNVAQALEVSRRGRTARVVHVKAVDATLAVLEDGRQVLLVPQDWKIGQWPKLRLAR
jgi:hypothetical protein